ncbi:glycosyltransferase [Arthrobacter sp.]|uniref:glycosyltransferase family 4 protein n=1 Tax=Arthrobacter sp. TaxID=1667 RepID=UPI003391C1B1
MRIGLVAPPWLPIPPLAYGGTEMVIDTLARGFKEAGHEVLLAAASDSKCPVPLVPGTAASDPDAVGTGHSELYHVIRAYEGMNGVDLVHDHTLAGPLYRGRPSSLPALTTVHGALTAQLAGIYQAMARHVSIVAISYRQLAGTNLQAAAVIHHGIDTGAVPVGKGLGGYACFLGRVSPDKGVAHAVTISRLAGIPLKIAAKMREPEELRYFHDVIEPMLGHNEEFLGEVGHGDKYRLLGDAMALLNPIQWPEPFGLVMIEALASGTPVVATRQGAAPEIIEPGVTGYLAQDDRELADLLPRAAALNRSVCRAAAENRFSAERMTADHLKLYARMLAGP